MIRKRPALVHVETDEEHTAHAGIVASSGQGGEARVRALCRRVSEVFRVVRPGIDIVDRTVTTE